jgi:hypothetical protein
VSDFVHGGGRAATRLIAACGVLEGSDQALELVGKARGIHTIGLSASADHHIGCHRSFTRGTAEILPSATLSPQCDRSTTKKSTFVIFHSKLSFPMPLFTTNLDGNGRALSFVDLRQQNH